ncbi:DoxX family protein [Chryseolinea soli]|uniref:DoxX family protein n=1 Tax=Chryseolinea soli TaxID=2321403 RepID=UPI001E2981EB|nr:DoxX family protein [Chryseolinea soli]
MISQKATAITGWILTILLAFLFSMSALMKLTLNETGLVQASALGIEAGTFRMIGVIEILSVILFVVPRTGVAGALLLIAYMGGAIATHVQHQQSVAGVVLIEVLIWLTASLRFPELGRRLIRYGEKNLG